jgi:DNA-binding NarL/FixJ family response regulator
LIEPGEVSVPERLPPPAGLRVARCCWEGEELLVLSWPLPIHAVPPVLTEAEREILDGLVAGEDNQDLARLRGTSQRTVANQIGSIFRKLGVSSRIELLARLHLARPTRR